MAPTKRKPAMTETSDFSKKAKLMLHGTLQSLAGLFMMAPEIDEKRTLKQQRRGNWVGAYPSAKDRREEYYVGGIAYSEEELDQVDHYGLERKSSVSSSKRQATASRDSTIDRQPATSASSAYRSPPLSQEPETQPYRLQPYTKPPTFTAPEFRATAKVDDLSSLASTSSWKWTPEETLDRSFDHRADNYAQPTHRFHSLTSRYDQESLLRARPRVYASKAQKTGSLLQSKYYNEDSITRQRTFERHSHENQKAIQSRLKAALDGTIGALRSESAKAEEKASDDLVNAHRRIRALNRGTHEDDEVDSLRKPAMRQPAWTKTMYLGNREPTWLKNVRNLINKSLPPSIEKQPKLPGYQAVVDEHERIEKELAAERQAGPKLTAEDEKRIKTVLSPGQGPVVDAFNMTITKYDMQTLRPGEWLNDSVIDFYSQLIIDRSKKTPSLPRVHVFTTHFFSTLAEHGYDKIRRWTKKFDIFALDYVLVPVHCSGNHWTTAVIDMKKRQIEYLDSLMGNNPRAFVLLRGYLDSEHKDKKKTPFDFSGWTDNSPKDIPRQRNGFDCGVFTCKIIECKSRGLDKFPFSQKDMEVLRKQMILSILNQKLFS